jgi:hypothetical protein
MTSSFDYFRWYRVVSATATNHVVLAGTDLDPELISNVSGMTLTRAFVFDNVVAVYEKNMTLEIQ